MVNNGNAFDAIVWRWVGHRCDLRIQSDRDMVGVAPTGCSTGISTAYRCISVQPACPATLFTCTGDVAVCDAAGARR
jgi:hypothetical protein